MPITYNNNSRRFEDDGNAIPPDEVVALIDKLSATAKRQARRISRQYEDGKITLDAWYAAILALLTSAHLVAATVGRGGIARMNADDWRDVQERLAYQEGYLSRWRDKIASGAFVVAVGAVAARAIRYVAPVYVQFTSAFQKAQTDGRDENEMLCIRELNAKESCSPCLTWANRGWIPVSIQPPIGAFSPSSGGCGNYCKCWISYEDEI